MAVLCGMPTIQYSARSARLSVRLFKWAWPKITSGQSNLTEGASPPQTGGSFVFARWRQCVLPWGHSCHVTTFFSGSQSTQPESTNQTTNRSVQPFSHSSRQSVGRVHWRHLVNTSSVLCRSVSLSVTLVIEACKNGWTDRDAVWVEDSCGPKEAQVQSYSPGDANVPSLANRSSAAAIRPYVKLFWQMFNTVCEAMIGTERQRAWEKALN